MTDIAKALGLVPSGQVKTPGGKTLTQVLPYMQRAALETANYSTIENSITCQAVPSSLFTNQGARYQATIPMRAVSRIKHIVVKIDLTITGAASVLAPSTHWFRQIELIELSGAAWKGVP